MKKQCSKIFTEQNLDVQLKSQINLLMKYNTIYSYLLEVRHNFNNFCALKKLFFIFHILQERDAKYLPSHIRLIYLIYARVLVVYFIYHSPTHSFPSHLFYRSQSISFTFTIFGYTDTVSYFNLMVSFIFHPVRPLETRRVFR